MKGARLHVKGGGRGPAMALEERLRLDATAGSPGIARDFVAAHLRRLGYDGIVASAALLTSELVTNAVLHAPGPFAVGFVDLGDGIVISVEDHDGDLPPAQRQEPWATGGRGLAIVDSIASAWGVAALPGDGKCVWFRLTGLPQQSETMAVGCGQRGHHQRVTSGRSLGWNRTARAADVLDWAGTTGDQHRRFDGLTGRWRVRRASAYTGAACRGGNR